MASFVENLRMGSIYNPFAGKNLQGGLDPITTFAQRVLPLAHAEQDRSDMRQRNFMEQMRFQQEQEQQKAAAKPMNTVFHEDISPLDKAKLGLEKQKIDTTRDIASGKLGFQHEKQDTDSAIRQQRANAYDRATEIKDYVASLRMSDEDKLILMNKLNEHMQELKGDQAIQQIGARGSNAQQLETQRQTGRESLETEKQKGRVELKSTPSGTPFQPTQQRAALRLRAEKFVNENPGMKDYIQFDPNDPNGFKVNVPDDASPDILHGINSYIYGGSYGRDTNLPASGAPAAAAPGTTAAPKAPTGWKYVPKQGGGWTAVEDKPIVSKPGGGEEE